MTNRVVLATTLASVLLLSACGTSWMRDAPPGPRAPPPPQPVATDSRDSSQSVDQIRDTQSRLRDRGFYHGPVDGVWGPTTENALREYQQKNNLTVTGKLNKNSLDSLHNPPAPPDQPQPDQPQQQR